MPRMGLRIQPLELPPEILLRIFAHASHIPGALSHDNESFVAFAHDKYGISVHRRYREVTDTLLACSRVCRAWAPLTTEFLFRYILIKSGHHALGIAEVLERCAHTPGSHNSAVGTAEGLEVPNVAGRWTIRVELALDGVHRWEDEHSAALSRILHHCPGTEIFSTAFCTTDVSLFQTDRFIQCMCDLGTRGRLIRLELKGDAELFDDILPFLAPTLCTLWLLPPRRRDASDGSDIDFPRLNTLVVDNFQEDDIHLSWEMPSMHTVALDDRHTPLSPDFLRIYGPQLRNLVTFRDTRVCLDLCPALEMCTIPCSWLRGASFTGLTTSIRRLTLMDDFVPPSYFMFEPDNMEVVVAWLASGAFPRLEGVRFLLSLYPRMQTHRTPDARLRKDGFVKLQAACIPRGITLEASIGGHEHTADVWKPLTFEMFLDA